MKGGAGEGGGGGQTVKLVLNIFLYKLTPPILNPFHASVHMYLNKLPPAIKELKSLPVFCNFCTPYCFYFLFAYSETRDGSCLNFCLVRTQLSQDSHV